MGAGRGGDREEERGTEEKLENRYRERRSETEKDEEGVCREHERKTRK